MEPKLDDERERHRQWERDVACYKEGIRCIFRRAGLPEDVIDDLTQETLLKAYLYRDRDITSIWRYLERIAVNMLIDFRNARARRLECSLSQYENDQEPDIPAEYGEDPEEALMKTAQSESIRAVLQQIRPCERALLVLHYLHDRPIKEIAIALGKKEGAIKMGLHRSRLAVKQKMDQLGLLKDI